MNICGLDGRGIIVGRGASGMGTPPRLWDLVTWRAELTPEPAVLVDNRGRSLSFAGLRDCAERVAAGLAVCGVGEGTRVMWQLPTSMESVVLSVALARLGAVQNPLIVLLREAEIGALDEQFQPELAVVPSQWRGFEHAAAVRKIAGERARILLCDHWAAPADGLALPQADPSELAAPPATDGPRWIFTTSGSTARPKGVLHTDASVYASSNAMVAQFPLGPEDVFPMAYPYAHIGGVAWLVTALRVGCRLLLLDVFDDSSPSVMAAHGATVLGSATPFFRAYLAAQRAHGPERLFDRLRFCMGGGAAIASDLDEVIRRELGGHGVVNGYGLTEFPIAGYPPVDDVALKASSSWFPGPGVQARVVRADGVECAAGEAGELRLHGPQRFAGYLGSGTGTAAFDEQGYVRTGDLAVLGARGEVTITGRLKEIVVRNAENISVAEVEAVLATHPAVADVAVVGLPDATRGERCCAVVTLAPGARSLTLADVEEHCRAAGLARYKTPEQLQELPSIPRNAMGKVQRQLVREALGASAAAPA